MIDLKYNNLIDNFTKSIELDKNSNSKILQIVSGFLNVKEEFIGNYEEYIRKMKRELKQINNIST
ncbi:hypothetical protein ACX43J_000197 [Staphylococcus pseudintermedius]